jgi:hypothetical protein
MTAKSFDVKDSYWDEGLDSYIQTIKPFLLYERTMRY